MDQREFNRKDELKHLYQFKIEDNGKGFNIDEVGLGNGLSKVKKRNKDLGGAVKIRSLIGEGTTIIVQVPI